MTPPNTELRVLRVHRSQQLDPPALLGRHAQEQDYATLVRESTVVYDEDERRVVLVYIAPVEEDTAALVAALRGLTVGDMDRTGGVVSRSAVFGSTPRNAIRHDYCRRAVLARDAPDVNALVASYAPVVARYYRRYGLGVYGAHRHQAARILPDWLIEETQFTSGIINKNSDIVYHYDSGNLNRVWSCMLALRHGVRGGYLSVPEYGLGFEIADKSLLMFDGQGIVHGVTPLTMEPNGYRYTVVFYTLKAMWQCGTEPEEWRRRQRKATVRRRQRWQASKE